ncbi:MAG: beta-propeller fold lactonase family protein [Rhizobacter sp.]|nr:beta-propeller fold lactonase family protein [Chlorobiales bacterium]
MMRKHLKKLLPLCLALSLAGCAATQTGTQIAASTATQDSLRAVVAAQTSQRLADSINAAETTLAAEAQRRRADSLAATLVPQLRKMKTMATDSCPKSIVISPDGATAYSINLEGMSVYAYDVAAKTLKWRIKFFPTPAKGWDYDAGKEISSFAEKPVEAAFTANGKYLWVSLHNGGNMVIIDTEWKTDWQAQAMKPGSTMPAPTLKVKYYEGESDSAQVVMLKEIKVGKTPKVIAATPNDSIVYVANWHSHSMSVVDTKTFEVLKEVKVNSIPRGIAFTPDGNTAYIAIMGLDSLCKMDARTHTVLKSIKVGRTPRHVVCTRDGKTLFVSLNSPGDLVKFDVATETVSQTVHVGSNPRTLTLSPDERYVYVVQYKDNQMAVLDAATLKTVGYQPTGQSPVGVAVTPDGREVWAVNYGSSTIDVFGVEMVSQEILAAAQAAQTSAENMIKTPKPKSKRKKNR